MHQEPADQLADKVRFLTIAMGRAPDRVVPSPVELGYRARVSLSGDAAGRLGYHKPRSHELVAVDNAAVQPRAEHAHHRRAAALAEPLRGDARRAVTNVGAGRSLVDEAAAIGVERRRVRELLHERAGE
jgi:tRNA/tmRNA/rRNA uracil-C5-methylase (TrmA/RlmC/RlmD family)